MPGSHGKRLEDMLTTIKQRVQAAAPAAAADAAKVEEDPDPCASRPSALWMAGLHVFGADWTRSFAYAHLGFKEYDPGNTWFVLEFNEPEKWRLKVWGRNLWEYFNYITQHKLEWVRVADRDFAGDGVPIILGFSLEPVKEAVSFPPGLIALLSAAAGGGAARGGA